MIDTSKIDWSQTPLHHGIRKAHDRIRTDIKRQWADDVLIAAAQHIEQPISDYQIEKIVDHENHNVGLRALESIPAYSILGIYPIHYGINATRNHIYDMIRADQYPGHQFNLFKEALSSEEKEKSFRSMIANNPELSKTFENYIQAQADMNLDQTSHRKDNMVVTHFREDFIGISMRQYTTKAYFGHLAATAINQDTVNRVVKEHYQLPMTMECYQQMVQALINVMSEKMNCMPIMFSDVSPLMLLVSTRPIEKHEQIMVHTNVNQWLSMANDTIAKTIKFYQGNKIEGYDIFTKWSRSQIELVHDAFSKEIDHLEATRSEQS